MKVVSKHVGVAMGRHVGAAMGRHTDLVLDASLPKHKNPGLICPQTAKFDIGKIVTVYGVLINSE